jgi:hypothetical protein
MITLSFSNTLEKVWPLKGINVEVRDLNLNENDIKNIASMNMNLIILNLEFNLFQNNVKLDSDKSIDKLLSETKKVIELIKKYNMKAIIAFTHLPKNIASDTKNSQFWNDANINKIYLLSEKIASYFANTDETLLAYKFLDEPLNIINGKSLTPKNWNKIQENIVEKIRNYDKDRYIVVTTGPGGTGRDYKDFSPLNDSNIIYGFHFFEPHSYTHQGINSREKDIIYPAVINNKLVLEYYMKSIIDFKEKFNKPILVGSFSAVHSAQNSDIYINDIINIFDKHNFSWAYWCYKGFNEWDINNDFLNNKFIRNELNSTRAILLKEKISKDTKDE